MVKPFAASRDMEEVDQGEEEDEVGRDHQHRDAAVPEIEVVMMMELKKISITS